MSYMNKCNRCQAAISSRRNFCTAHYIEALAQYESDLVVYQNNIEIWNSMSSTDQAAAHGRAEDMCTICV